MNRRQKIIVSVTGIFLVLLILVGLTYAYFLTRINGNTNPNSISVSTSNLAISWINGTINKIESETAILPGKFTQTMNFQVENTGDDEAEYEVVLTDFRVKWGSTVSDTIEVEGVDTYLEYPSDMELIITCKSYDTRSDRDYSEATESGVCSGKEGYLPTTNDVLVFNQIPDGKTHVYELTLNYKETGKNQSADMNKTIEGLIDIRDPKESADIEGYVANYNEGDYVQSNSTERISSINKNGYYKILGLEFDDHIISVRDLENNIETSKDISIKKGKESGIEDTEITVTNEERIINIDIDVKSKNFLIDKEIKQYNPYKEGTLVAEIINNAQNTTLEEEKNLNYAYYRNKPLTVPGKESVTRYLSVPNFPINGSIKPTSSSYFVYSDKVNVNPKTGYFTMVNAKYGKYSEIYEDLKGKYIIGSDGYQIPRGISESLAQENTISGKEFGRIFKVGENSDVTTMYHSNVIFYYNSTWEAIESTLSNTTDELGRTYYYRGNVQDNYMNFANMCWRIVRIEGDGSIKLILEDQYETCEQKNDTDGDGYVYNGNWNIGTSVYGYAYEPYNVPLPNYEKYSGGLKDTLVEWGNSVFKDGNGNFNDDGNKLKSDKICVEYNGNFYKLNTNELLSASETNEIVKNKGRFTIGHMDINLICPNQAKSNNDYIVFPMSAAEVKLAGTTYGGINHGIYLLNKFHTAGSWFTISPLDFNTSTSYVSGVNQSGQRISFSVTDSSIKVRPAVSIKSEYAIYNSGNGTITDPYTIK